MSDNDFMMSDADSYEFEFEDEEDDDPLGNGCDSDMEDLDEEDILGVATDSENEQAHGALDYEEETKPYDDNEADAESLYYKAKHLKQANPERALPVFAKISTICIDKDQEVEEFKFKAVKQSLKILYKLNRYVEFATKFKEIFTVNLSTLNKLYVEQSFNKMIEGYFGLPKDVQLGMLSSLVSQYALNERLRVKLLIKKFTILAELGQFDEILDSLSSIYKELEGNDDDSSGMNRLSNLLEFYAIELQIHLKTNNLPKLKSVYQKTQSITHIVPHSKISAIIKESSGLISLNEENFELASSEFFESFKNYDEVGDNIKRIRILKFLIVSSMLNTNKINKFESQEIQFFLKNEVISKYLNLLKYFENLNFSRFEEQYNMIYQQENAQVEVDVFLLENLMKIFKNFQLAFLINYIKPFKRLSLRKISQILKIDVSDIEYILVGLKFNDELPNITLDLIDGIIFNESL